MNCQFKPIAFIPKTRIMEEQKPLNEVIYSTMLDIIKNAKDVPGLQSEEFANTKEEIVRYLNLLMHNSVIEITGTDKEVRPNFVGFQVVMEQALANLMRDGKLKNLIGVIHASAPYTPLCTNSKDPVNTSLEKDPRATIIRDYLYQGGDLYIAYPEAGMKERSKEQRSIYFEELDIYSSTLFDTPLPTEFIPTPLIGATYCFTDKDGKNFVFAIKISETNDSKENADFGLWFGAADHKAVKDRLDTVMRFINEVAPGSIPL